MNKSYPKTYKKNGQSVYSFQYLVSFCTKYKRKIFSKEDLKVLEKSFKDTAKKYDFLIKEIELESNKVNLIIELFDPKFTINDAVIKLKKESKDALIEYDKSFKSRIPSIWTREEFISSIGSISLEEVRKFVELQDNYIESITKNK